MQPDKWHSNFGGGSRNKADWMPTGMEYGAPVGSIQMSSPKRAHMSRPVLLASETKGRRVIGGYATMWNKAHYHKGRFEMFATGAFAQTLLRNKTVRFLDEHDEAKCVAATNGDGLDLWSDETGLGFNLTVPDTAAGDLIYSDVLSGKRCGMSVRYTTLEAEEIKAGGDVCHVIQAAMLNEISLVEKGAVSQAYAKVMDRTTARHSNHSELSKRSSEAASAVSASFRKVRDLLEAMEDQGHAA